MARFSLLDEEGREIATSDMPRKRLFAGEEPKSLLIHSIVRATGEDLSRAGDDNGRA